MPSGSTRAYRESFESLWFAFGLGLVVAYLVLASQFNAFSHPFTVLLALPFSISGALFALWIAGQSLNVYSMLGLILLVGIAKKNSIMLVDFTNQFRERGVERHQALLQACPIRLRPILMTSVATIAGALPAGAGHRPRRRGPEAHGAGAGGRDGGLDAAHALRRARGLQRPRRRAGVEPAAPQGRRGAARGAGPAGVAFSAARGPPPPWPA